MGAAVAITRDDYSADGLRAEARRAEDSKQACRLLALAMVLDGVARKVSAETCGMDRQTLPDWVHRYNAEGIDGLRDRPRPGRPPGLSAAQMVELDELVVAGPDPAVHRVVRWRCFDLREVIKQRFEVEITERHVGRLLRQLKLTRLTVRPRHPEADEAAQEAFKKTSPRS